MTTKTSDKVILDLCGGTGAWSRPYAEAGYDVRVVTLPEHNVTDWWIADGFIRFRKNVAKMDGMTYSEIPIDQIHGVLAAPPCSATCPLYSFTPRAET